ncbi:hypothetical protein HDF09_003296 [Edaphobacter lichenicola]|uniref:Uncharacterized protein n=1 Tax=Tunturiibacter empetritectus TaxID=3069691 RepID=A0A7W8MSP9_9BACT|nr:hypothetical protein [Edaphobacter lichenicola]
MVRFAERNVNVERLLRMREAVGVGFEGEMNAVLGGGFAGAVPSKVRFRAYNLAISLYRGC